MTSRRIRKKQSDYLNIRSRAISLNSKRREDVSRQTDVADLTASSSLAGSILSTPYNLQTIATLYEQSNVLRQCVNAMVTNITLFGKRIVPITKDTKISEPERKLLQSFIDSPNPEESLSTLDAKKVEQYEKYGFGFYEVIRNRAGKPSLIRHAKSLNMRLLKKDTEPQKVTYSIVRGGSRSQITEWKRFRRYVQVIGVNKVYFKEFGDPRKMSYKTGEYSAVPKGEEATELLHCRQNSEDAYGLPRWIAQLPNILGSREAEEVNLRYFEDNTVPPMILSIAGGRLTRASFNQLRALLESHGLGRERQNQILLIEAVPEVADLEGKGTVSIKIDKLTDSRQSDGLFKDYDQSNITKVRSSFRLPPVILGLSQDVTFATANVSAYLAETQVFQPERFLHDEFFNKNFVNHPKGLDLKTCKLQSKGPSLTNPEQIIKMMTAVNVMGGLTPRKVIDIINDTMGFNIKQYPEPSISEEVDEWYDWMDTPMPIAQRQAMGLARTQQTGEGGNTQDGQQLKDQTIKDTEQSGAVEPQPVEHGQE